MTHVRLERLRELWAASTGSTHRESKSQGS